MTEKKGKIIGYKSAPEKKLEQTIKGIANTPAFPINFLAHNHLTGKTETVSFKGMSLRDYKQTKYMAALLGESKYTGDMTR